MDQAEIFVNQSLAENKDQVILNKTKLGILSYRKKSKRKATHTGKDDTDTLTSLTEETKKYVLKMKHPRSEYDSKKSSDHPSSSDVGFDNKEIKVDLTDIEKELLRKLTSENIVFDNCSQLTLPYPAYIFTNREWQMITRENPYLITDLVLPTEVLSSLRSASADSLEGKTAFLFIGDSEIGRVVSQIFNNMCSSVPDVAQLKHQKMSTPSGFTPLQQQKDRLKVQLRGRKSINQLLKAKGGPEEAVLLTNQGDLVESDTMDLKYDGLYRSWPFLTTRLAKDKTTIARIKHSAFYGTRGTVEFVKSDTTTPPLQIQYMRDLPDIPQRKKLLN
ncbi:14689_t:CDS:2 [Funneliformis caledonium]|uniref:14689_t:CDS:1 n=1 Tax=Funneliformis caledonium TaxID=1117310 RepID=A0A9N8YYV3_9GLOM|nr:14689_t:CDS:2 [Funneliformis caledonium]